MPKKTGLSAVQRTHQFMRDLGYKGDVVERWIPTGYGLAGGMRKDFLNIIDLIYLGKGETIGLQVCGTDFAEHVHKIKQEEENLRIWLEGGNRFILIGWRKVVKERGKKQKVWKPRFKEYRLTNSENQHETTS